MKQIIIFSVILWAHGASFAALVDTGERQPLRAQAPVSESDVMDWYKKSYGALKTFKDPLDTKIFAQFLYRIWLNKRAFRKIHNMEAPEVFSFNPLKQKDLSDAFQKAYYGFKGIHTLVSNSDECLQKMAKMAVKLFYQERVDPKKYEEEYERHVTLPAETMKWYQEEYGSSNPFEDPVHARIFASFIRKIREDRPLFKRLHGMGEHDISRFTPFNSGSLFDRLRDVYNGSDGLHTPMPKKKKLRDRIKAEALCDEMVQMAAHIIYRKKVGKEKYNKGYARYSWSRKPQ